MDRSRPPTLTHTGFSHDRARFDDHETRSSVFDTSVGLFPRNAETDRGRARPPQVPRAVDARRATRAMRVNSLERLVFQPRERRGVSPLSASGKDPKHDDGRRRHRHRGRPVPDPKNHTQISPDLNRLFFQKLSDRPPEEGRPEGRTGWKDPILDILCIVIGPSNITRACDLLDVNRHEEIDKDG